MLSAKLEGSPSTGARAGKRPQNIYQLKELLPVIRRIGGRDIRLGCMLGNLSFLVRDEKLAGLIGEWEDSSDFKKIAEEASGRLRIRGGHEAEINDMVERLDDSKSLGVIQRPFCGAGGKEQMKGTP